MANGTTTSSEFAINREGQVIRLITGTPLSDAEIELQGIDVGGLPDMRNFVQPPQQPPTPQEPEPTRAITSSSPARDQTETNVEELGSIEQGIRQPTTPPPPAKTETDKQLEALSASSEAILQSLDKEINFINNAIDSRITQLDANTEAQISGIKESFERLRFDARELSKARKGGLTILNIRSGRQRFAPELAQSVITEEERRLARQMSDLNSQEASLIRQAQEARDEKSFQLLNLKMNQLRSVRQEQRQTINDMFDRVLKLEQIALTRAKEAREREEFVLKRSTLLSQSVAPAILPQITDDPKANEAMIKNIANTLGIDPLILTGELEEIRREAMIENTKLAFEEARLGFEQTRLGFEEKRLGLEALRVQQGAQGLALRAEEIALKRQEVAIAELEREERRGELANLSNIIRGNPTLFNSLSASDRAELLPFLEATGFDFNVKELPEKVIEGFVDMDSVRGIVNEIQFILQGAGGDLTGPVAPKLGRVAAFFGVEDKDRIRFRDLSENLFRTVLKATSGVAASEREVERLRKFLPTENKQESENRQNLTDFLAELNKIEYNSIKRWKSQKYDVSGQLNLLDTRYMVFHTEQGTNFETLASDISEGEGLVIDRSSGDIVKVSQEEFLLDPVRYQIIGLENIITQ